MMSALGTVLRTEDVGVNKTDKGPVFMELIISASLFTQVWEV